MPHDELLFGMIAESDRLNILNVQGTYTPVLSATTTPPTLGTGAVADGQWWRSGHWIEGLVRFTFGASMAAGSGTYLITVPFPPDIALMGSSTTGGAAQQVGNGRVRDLGTGANSNTVTCQFRNQGGTEYLWMLINGSNTGVTQAAPVPWVEGDMISVRFGYLADPATLPSP